MKQVTSKNIEEVLGFKLSQELADRIDSYNLIYEDLTKEERDQYLLRVVDVLTNDIVVSGKHRIAEWEKGWSENLELFKTTKDINLLIPKYHGKNKLVRWNGDIIKPLVDNFDYKIHICFVDAILEHYIKNDITDVYEFGCGPAYHLIRLSQKNKWNLHGSDWTKASQELIKEINNNLNLNIDGFNFNFFEPNYEIDFSKNSAIYTVAALEQIGNNYEAFVDFLIKKSPDICIHMEPIEELLDETRLIDFLSIKYFRKRNYLQKFLPYLEQLEKEGKIEILKKQRIYTGSFFIEGHSLIVWKPKKD